MADPQPTPDLGIPEKIREVADLLRRSRQLGPETRQAIAELVEELGGAMNPATVSTPEAAHLAESAAHLARVLQEKSSSPGLLAAAKERLQEAAVRAEADAPLATGIVQRLIDTLANLGI